MFRGCLEGVWGDQGVFRVYFVSETAQVELKSGPVSAPASGTRTIAPGGGALAPAL